MLEVLVKGNLPEDKVYQGTCTRCGCTVRGPKRDWRTTSCQRDGETVSADCPTPGCGYPIYGQKAPPQGR